METRKYITVVIMAASDPYPEPEESCPQLPKLFP
jgi:hypothetical protein